MTSRAQLREDFLTMRRQYIDSEGRWIEAQQELAKAKQDYTRTLDVCEGLVAAHKTLEEQNEKLSNSQRAQALDLALRSGAFNIEDLTRNAEKLYGFMTGGITTAEFEQVKRALEEALEAVEDANTERDRSKSSESAMVARNLKQGLHVAKLERQIATLEQQVRNATYRASEHVEEVDHDGEATD